MSRSSQMRVVWEPSAVLAVSSGRPDDHPGHPAVEIAIYPDVVWLTARSLRTHATSPRGAS